MIESNVNLKLSIWGNFTQIDAKQSNYDKLATIFPDFSPFPNQENGISLISSTKEWLVSIGTVRIDVQQVPVDESSSKEQSIEQFLQESAKYLGNIMKLFEIKAQRLAFNHIGLCTELTPELMNELGKKFSMPFRYFDGKEIHTWNMQLSTHGNCKIHSSLEQTNEIVLISRITGQRFLSGKVDFLDTVQIIYDINTLPDNKDFRFEEASLAEFSDYLLQTTNQLNISLEHDINDCIDGESMQNK